jgi:sigma-B regulation protein RsbU (phosphoserine phosphatase)
MATLPPVTLGVIILSAFTVVALLRAPLERRLVSLAPISARPKRQFTLDLTLYLFAGLMAVVFNLSVYNFPVASGISLLFGCIVAGFFMSLDMSLFRERAIIVEAMEKDESLPPPKRLFPVTRKFSLVAVATTLFVALIIVMVISRDIIWLSQIEKTEAALMAAQLSVTYEIFFIMAVLLAMTINLILSYSKNLGLLFNNETRILERVTNGDLSRLVPVATSDEFGLIADYTNTMIMGLRDRIKMIAALKLAEEVQQNLLPQLPPHIDGLDISGVSIYCDETGGDYYDYLELPHGAFGIAVADAADHGVGAALHMATARAFLISGVRHYEKPSDVLQEINRYLVNDGMKTGRFVSMFLVFIDPTEKSLSWIRAGHEPALLFDPTENAFQILDGDGIVLGVDENYRYQASERRGWAPGSVLVIGTDGIHETRDAAGEFFGRQRLQNLIRQHHSQSAETIQNAIVEDLVEFRADMPQEDDITLVVVKLD